MIVLEKAQRTCASRGLFIRTHHLCLMAVILVSVALNASVLAFIAHQNPAYLSDYRASIDPDGLGYVRIGQNVFLHGAFTSQEHGPYGSGDMRRTPLYPLIAGGANLLFGAIWPLYLFQMVLSTGTSIILYVLISRLFSPAAGLFVGLLHATDPTLAVLNSKPFTESSFLFFTTLGLFFWLRTVLPLAANPRRYLCSFLGGLTLGLAALIRPTGLYLPILIFGIHGAILIRRKMLSHIAQPAVVFLSAYALVIPWIVRNHSVFGVWRYTSVDSSILCEFVGAGVYQTQFGFPTREAALGQLNSDYHLVDTGPVPIQDLRRRETAWDIFRKYPQATVWTLGAALGRGLFSHNMAELADLARASWVHPSLDGLWHGDVRAFTSRLQCNHPFLIALFVWTELLALASCLWTFAAVFLGIVVGKHRPLMLATLALAAYFAMNIVLQAPIPDPRMRVPLYVVLLFLLPFVIYHDRAPN
jgi:4-amino-4-deoxy-L-arabinose transferase-like glycosyltransferase